MWYTVACEVLTGSTSELRTWIVFSPHGQTATYESLRAQAQASLPHADRVRLVISQVPKNAITMICNGAVGALP